MRQKDARLRLRAHGRKRRSLLLPSQQHRMATEPKARFVRVQMDWLLATTSWVVLLRAVCRLVKKALRRTMPRMQA